MCCISLQSWVKILAIFDAVCSCLGIFLVIVAAVVLIPAELGTEDDHSTPPNYTLLLILIVVGVVVFGALCLNLWLSLYLAKSAKNRSHTGLNTWFNINLALISLEIPIFLWKIMSRASHRTPVYGDNSGFDLSQTMIRMIYKCFELVLVKLLMDQIKQNPDGGVLPVHIPAAQSPTYAISPMQLQAPKESKSHLTPGALDIEGNYKDNNNAVMKV